MFTFHVPAPSVSDHGPSQGPVHPPSTLDEDVDMEIPQRLNGALTDIPADPNSDLVIADPVVIGSMSSLVGVPSSNGVGSLVPGLLPEPCIVRTRTPPRDVMDFPSSTTQHQPQQPAPVTDSHLPATIPSTVVSSMRSQTHPGEVPTSDNGFSQIHSILGPPGEPAVTSMRGHDRRIPPNRHPLGHFSNLYSFPDSIF